ASTEKNRQNADQTVELGRLVDQAGATMTDVVASVARVSAIITDITAPSQAQSEGIANTNHAIGLMDEATHQNAALVEQAAAAAESLQEQATNLARAMGVFKLAGEPMPSAAPVRAIGAAAPRTRPGAPRKAVAQLKLA
ncbi:MAG: methyl-accepting chemotaxis protein, partial [Pseudomonadota bacterium]